MAPQESARGVRYTGVIFMMKDAIRHIRKTLIAGLVTWGVTIPVVGEARLVLNLETERDTLVVGEPIKLSVVLRNGSTKSDHYVGFDKYHNSIIYEISGPGFKKVRRYAANPSPGIICGYNIGKSRKTEPLHHGDIVMVYCYPQLTWGKGASGIETFTDPGKYKIRVVYDAKTVSKRPVYSNTVELTLVSPTVRQKEIFDAYWAYFPRHSPRQYITEGMRSGRGEAEEKLIRSVIAKYPDCPEVKYAYYALLGMLCAPFSPRTPPAPLEDILELGELLQRKFPEFRFVEVRMIMGFSLRWVGKDDEALEYYRECLMRDPRLGQNYYFVIEVFVAKGNYNGHYHWLRKRRLGINHGMTLADI